MRDKKNVEEFRAYLRGWRELEDAKRAAEIAASRDPEHTRLMHVLKDSAMPTDAEFLAAYAADERSFEALDGKADAGAVVVSLDSFRKK